MNGDTGQLDAIEEPWSLLPACQDGSADAFTLRDAVPMPLDAADEDAWLARGDDGVWRARPAAPAALAELLSLYGPLLQSRHIVVGHLGQSLDGFVATAQGQSHFVNDSANIVHLHRMRALCDAVVVGGATVLEDDPRLTVRRTCGGNPLRVVIDPRLDLDDRAGVFTDGAAQTLRVCTEPHARPGVDAVQVPCDARGRPDLAHLCGLLRARGCGRIFIEGGGITVSRFLDAGLLDRLHLALAPLLIGEGRPGLRLPAQGPLADCPRPAWRIFRMGADLLYDLDLRQQMAADRGPGGDCLREL